MLYLLLEVAGISHGLTFKLKINKRTSVLNIKVRALARGSEWEYEPSWNEAA